MFEIEGIQINFAPVNGGEYTHRVIVARKVVDWLHQRYEPNAKAAKYYYSKHILKQDNPQLLAKAQRQEKRHQPWSKEAFATWCLAHQFEIVGKSGDWRSESLPLERYIEEMTQAGLWKQGQFFHDDMYQNRTQWMIRFNHYCESLREDEIYGYEVHQMLMGKEWNKTQYDQSFSV